MWPPNPPWINYDYDINFFTLRPKAKPTNILPSTVHTTVLETLTLQHTLSIKFKQKDLIAYANIFCVCKNGGTSNIKRYMYFCLIVYS